MTCPDWPPPLPSLPLYPPCSPPQPPKKEVKIVNSICQQWWDAYLSDILSRASGHKAPKKGQFFELTKQQRRELLSVRTPTRQDKLIWSIPLPEGSYPANGLPIWERLYLDRRLPMLKSPPNALVFARQQIGKKLWKDTKGQEFILYDPHNYEVAFSYESVHDPNLSSYYQGEAIRGFLLSVGDANEDGWGICTLRRFNLYRKYLKRVHLSLVHSEMEKQEALKDEIHNVNIYKQTIRDTLDAIEKRVTMEEAGAALREAQRQYHLKRVDRILDAIKEKEDRVKKLYLKRAEESEARRQKGLKLQEQQDLKNKIANEIARRKKITTLRCWHDREDKRMRWLKKTAEDKARQKAEKVSLRWQNKIDNLRKMFERDDEFLKLQTEIKEKNVEIRNQHLEHLKKKELEKFQELKKASLDKKSLHRRVKNDKKMESAITKSWLSMIGTDYDLAVEIYRIKKSINSTMAELLTQPTEGPDPFSIIVMTRNRIQREQSVPLQVSFAIDVLLETTIEKWAKIRLHCMLDAVVREVKKEGHKRLAEIKARRKNINQVRFENFKTGRAFGTIYKPDAEKKSDDIKKKKTREDSESTDEERVIRKENLAEGGKGAVAINHVHIGTSKKYDSPYEPLPPEFLKPVKDRPKTPMPSHDDLCRAAFQEEGLREILPTMTGDVVDLKEKRKFRKTFKNVAVRLCERVNEVTEYAYEPSSRLRAINKLILLGDTDRNYVVNVLCDLVMTKPEKSMFESEEFERLVQIIARETINDVLKPPMFQRQQNDSVSRTKIMFYKPKQKNRRSNQ